MEDNILFKEESYAIQGVIFEVYKEVGRGFLEGVYQECLEREFSMRSIPFKAQASLQVMYKGEPLQQAYIPDFICYDKIIVEIKAVKAFAPEHKAQLLNYLKITKFELGYLINFSAYPKVELLRLTNFKNKQI